MSAVTIGFLSTTWNRETEERLKIMKQAAPQGAVVIGVDSSQSEGELIERLAGASVVIPWRGGFPLSVARECRNLRLIQLLSAGYDAYDVAGLAELGIQLANNGGSNAVPVSEHTVALILSVYRQITLAWEAARDGKWREGLDDLPFRTEVSGKTVGIIGFGNIGRQVARRLSGFDVQLLYNDVLELPPGRELELGGTAVSLDDLLRRSDVVTLHVPLNRSTHKMISDREFSLMKPTAILINACRGPVVDEAALVRALDQSLIAGAGIDVFEQEPTPPDNPLLRMPNVVATPHWAGGTRESSERSTRFALSNVRRLVEGRPLLSVVEPED